MFNALTVKPLNTFCNLLEVFFLWDRLTETDKLSDWQTEIWCTTPIWRINIPILLKIWCISVYVLQHDHRGKSKSSSPFTLPTGRRWASRRRQRWRRQSRFLSRARNSPHKNCTLTSLWTRVICQCKGVTFTPVTKWPLNWHPVVLWISGTHNDALLSALSSVYWSTCMYIYIYQ